MKLLSRRIGICRMRQQIKYIFNDVIYMNKKQNIKKNVFICDIMNITYKSITSKYLVYNICISWYCKITYDI